RGAEEPGGFAWGGPAPGGPGPSGGGPRQSAMRRAISSSDTSRFRVRRPGSITIVSPSRTAAVGPPRAASGEMCPIRMPCDTPEKRPSVISATSSPRPRRCRLAREVLLFDPFPEVLVRPPFTRRHLPGVVLEPIGLGQDEPLHVAVVNLARLQEARHRGATEERQVAAEQDPVEAGQDAVELVGMRGDELVHARIAPQLWRKGNSLPIAHVRTLEQERNPILPRPTLPPPCALPPQPSTRGSGPVRGGAAMPRRLGLVAVAQAAVGTIRVSWRRCANRAADWGWPSLSEWAPDRTRKGRPLGPDSRGDGTARNPEVVKGAGVGQTRGRGGGMPSAGLPVERDAGAAYGVIARWLGEGGPGQGR